MDEAGAFGKLKGNRPAGLIARIVVPDSARSVPGKHRPLPPFALRSVPAGCRRPGLRPAASLFLAVGFVTSAALPATARQVPNRTLQDSIAALTDSALFRLLTLAPPSAGDVEAQLVRGFAGLRAYGITGDAAAIMAARRAFDAAAAVAPHDARARLGLGLSWARGHEATRSPPTIVAGRAFTEALGRDPAARALRAFRRALELDSTLVAAATALVPIAVEKRDDDALRKARATLAAAERRGDFDRDALSALARANATLGLHAEAVEAARRAAAMAGPAPAERYGYAIALFGADRDEEGALAWFDAIDILDDDTADRLGHDLRPVTDEWEEAGLARSSVAARKAWLRDFWNLRAALGGVTVPTRIGDHYRRLAVAQARYPRRRKWGTPPTNALLLERPDLPFDDRGIIYVRHGEPWEVLRSSDLRLDSESWIYRTPEGGFTALHFFNYGSATRAVDVPGNSGAYPANGGFGDAYNEFVLAYNLPCDDGWRTGRVLYDRRISLLRCNEYDVRSISAEIRREARHLLRTDSDRPVFVRELPFAFEMFSFRGLAGRTDVTAALVLPPGSITAVPAYGGFAADAETSFVLVDTLFDRVLRADTTLRTVTPTPLSRDAALRLHVTLAALPGAAQALRLTVRDASDRAHGQLYGAALDVPDFHRAGLQLSDIVLAEPDSGGTFVRRGVALDLVPTREFPGGSFLAFYEIYNATDDGTLATELLVEKASGGIRGFLRGLLGGGPVVHLRFQTPVDPDDGIVQQLRRVDTSLDPGDYRIRVRVSDPVTGTSAERTRAFTVVSVPRRVTPG